MDAVNMEVFSASSDSTVKVCSYEEMSTGLHSTELTSSSLMQFWSFHSKSLLHTLELESPVAMISYHRERYQ